MSSSSPGGSAGGRPPLWVVILGLLVLMARLTEAAQNLRHVLADSDSITNANDKIKPKASAATNDLVNTEAATSNLVHDDVVEDTAEPISTPIVKSDAAKDTTEKNLRHLAESSNNDQDVPDDEVEPDFMYWVTPLQSLGLTCGGSSIKSRDGEYTCIKAGEALCQDNGGGPFGRWTFGITEDNQVNLWTPKNEIAWTFCTEVSHVCIGEERDPRPDKYSNQRPYLYFYDEKTQRTVGNLTCDGTDGFKDENLDKPTILKMVDNSDVGMYTEYNTTVLKFKKGQTPDPGDSNELLNITVARIGEDMAGSLSFNDDKCVWTDVCEDPITSTTTFIPNNTAIAIELTGVVGISFPRGFFEDDALVEVAKVVSAFDPEMEQLFKETALIYSPIQQEGYHIKLRSSSVPSERHFALVTLSLTKDFALSIPETDQVEVFVRIEQSSDVEDTPIPTFVLVDEDLDEDHQIISFWLPTFAFILSNDGSFSTDIFIASTPGRDDIASEAKAESGAENRRRLVRESDRPSTCEGVSIQCPLQKGCDTINSPYNLNRYHPRLMKYKPHYGVDYNVRIGDNVIAASSGTVELVKTQVDKNTGEATGYGLYLVLRHDDGGATLYAHLSSALVALGEKITVGEVIGLAGASGNPTGANLHFEYVPSGAIIQSKHRIDPHPCVLSVLVGAITVGDIGAAADDSFKIFISGGTLSSEIFLGKTEIGETNNFAATNLRQGRYTLTLEVDIAPDGIPTFGIRLNEGITFVDGSTSVDYVPLLYPNFVSPGDRVSFDIIVPGGTDTSVTGSSCQDSYGNRGECLYSSSCEGDDRVAIEGFCPAFSSDSDVKCCIKTPKCNAIGGTCLKASDCDSVGYSTPSGYCPGGTDIKCCVKNDVCSTRDNGECKSEAGCRASSGISSLAFCPGSSSNVCCTPAPSCRANVPSGEVVDGTCYQDEMSCIDDLGIPTPSFECIRSFCCIKPRPKCTPEAYRNLYVSLEGSCNVEGTNSQGQQLCIGEHTYSEDCPVPSKCCYVVPSTPLPCLRQPVSDIVTFKFDTRLLDADIGTDSLEFQHSVQVDVQCFDCDGELYPEISISGASVINKFDDEYLRFFDTLPADNGKELLVRWVGAAWEGDWKDDERDLFSATVRGTAEAAAAFSLGADAVEWVALKNAGKPLNGARFFADSSNYALKNINIRIAGRTAFNANGKLGFLPIIGSVSTLAFSAWDAFFDVQSFFLYRNSVRFSCEDDPIKGIIPVASEVYGSESEVEGNIDRVRTKYPSAPAYNILQSKKTFGPIYLQHVSTVLAGGNGKIQQYVLPSGESAGFGPTKRFSLDTQLVEMGGLWTKKAIVREHHRSLISLRCTDEGSIDVSGYVAPTIVKSGKSSLEVFIEGLDAQSDPQMSQPIIGDNGQSLVFFVSGVAVNGDLKSAAVVWTVFSVIGAVVLLVAGASVPVTIPFAAAASMAIIAGTLAEKAVDVEYTWAYVRRFEFKCVRNGPEWIVTRVKEEKMCSYFKEVDNDEEDYFVRVDSAANGGDTYSPQLAVATAPRYEVLDDCEMPNYSPGEYSNFPEDFLASN